MGKILNTMTTEKRVEHLRAALGAKRDFDSWLAQMKVWIAQTEGTLPYESVAPADVLAAFTAAAQLGLLIDGEECMVMVRGRKNPKVKCEICAKGVVRKAGQAGWTINARTIKDGDLIEIDEGGGTVKHAPAWLRGDKAGDTLGYYAVATKRGGQSVVRSMSVEEANKRSTGTGAWKDWSDQMGEKSAILALRKVLYFGDEIEELIASSGAATGDTWALSEAEKEAAEEPQHPPQSARDKVMAQAARDQQDEAAEAPQEPAGANQAATDEDFVQGQEKGPSYSQEELDMMI